MRAAMRLVLVPLAQGAAEDRAYPGDHTHAQAGERGGDGEHKADRRQFRPAEPAEEIRVGKANRHDRGHPHHHGRGLPEQVAGDGAAREFGVSGHGAAT
jgi:hypothetical protein